MRRIWSEINKRRLWRRIWVALAGVQAELGLVTAAQVADLGPARLREAWRGHPYEAIRFPGRIRSKGLVW
jgi:adenylosuccinate lyase